MLPVSVAAAAGPGLVAGAVDATRLLLGAPWWLVVGPLALLGASDVPSWVVQGVPVLVNLVLHVLLLRVVRRRTATGEALQARDDQPAVRRWPASRSAQFGLAIALGALVWGAWLGWDRTASFDIMTGTTQYPYVTLQVAGCAVTVGLLTGVLASRWSPLAVAAGVSVGFLVCWTTQAAATDSTGLYLVGAMMLTVGLTGGTALAAAVGHVVGLARQQRRTA